MRNRRNAKRDSVAATANTPEDNPIGETEPAPDPTTSTEKKRVIAKPKKGEASGTAKKGPPSVDEWQDVIGRVFLRLLTEAFVALMLGDLVDELTEDERESIRLSKDDLRDIAAPLASVADKTPYLRKHGRSIVALANSYEAIVILLLWMRRVQRIGKRYKKAYAEYEPEPQPIPLVKETFNGTVGSSGENDIIPTANGYPSYASITVRNPTGGG